ncbi:MAG: flippase [Eubacterium sp.]|nr:flippase [Eubacterium sp.]
MSEIKQKSIKKNFIMNAILTMSGMIFPLITYPYVIDIIGKEGTGAVKFATSVIAYFAMFAQLGIPTYGIKACAKVRDDKEKLSKTVHELMLINLMMSVVVYVLFFASLFIIPQFAEDRILLIIVSSTMFFNMIGIEYLYRGLEQYSYITIRSLIFKALGLVLMFILVRKRSDVEMYGAITIFAASASNIFNFIYARKLISFRRQKQLDLKKHIRPVMVFFAMSCATQVYLNLDGIMLGFMKGKAVVGDYDSAVKIKVILVSVVTSLGAVLLPRASYYIKNKKMDEFRRITAKALHFVWVFATPLTVYFIFFAKEGIRFLTKDECINAIPAMQIIVPTVLFIGLSNILGIQILVPIGKEKIVLYSEIGGAVVDLVLNAIFIPKYDAAGAAFGTTVAELIVVMIQLYFMRDIKDQIDIKQSFAKIGYWKIIIALIAAIPASIWVKMIDASAFTTSIRLESFIILAISATMFFAVYLLLMIILKDKLTKEIVDGLVSKFKKKKQID